LAIFTKSLIKNQKQDEKLLAKRWLEYQKYKEKSSYIKTLKEEKYQEGFFKDLFEACLGYTLDTTDHTAFNLEREKKNETDAKKADGVIYVDKKVVGVVELKAQDSKNLDKAADQAFGYLVSHSDARYVIVSNFDELRFYIDKKTEYEKFNLFDLDYESFKKLHLILSYESIKEGVPLHLKEKTASFESDISKELYKDFSTFRTHLFENIVKNNTEKDPSKLLRLTQKLCDRIIFILFAEDRGLLNANTIGEIRKRHELDVFGNSLYEYYKIYFHAVNEGNEKLNIPKYNGGLFAKDEELDSLSIDDSVLDMEAQKLSDYDFDSEVSVNILGHIFEQSLTDLEEIQANIEQKAFDKAKGKRKKDGVFYTPEYITRYIVQNTLGRLCQDKQKELGIEDITPPKNAKKPTKKEQKQKQNLEEYRKWLLELKILDPACGSGAFLNQALEYLIAEHNSLLEKFVTMGDITATYEIEKNILENNLYGVDINEDATEIAKLSLWLRTAHRGRELTKLADKIKTGNSLIDDKSVSADAFVWEEEFKEVFESGGFDVVIGNPPWGAKLSKENINHLKSKYPIVTSKTHDSYLFFMLLSLNVLKENGLFSFIIPNTWMLINTAQDIRNELLKFNILAINDYGDGVFDGVTAESSICIIQNRISNKEVNVQKFKNNQELFSYSIDKNNWKEDAYQRIVLEKNNDVFKFLSKIYNKYTPFSDIADIIWGIKPYQVGHGIPPQTKEMMKERVYHSNIKHDDTYKPLLVGANVDRYKLYFDGKTYIKYGKNLMYPSNKEKITHPKILLRQTSDILRAVYDDKAYFPQNSLFIISSDKINLKYLQVLLNSKLINYFYWLENPQTGKTFAEIKPSVVKLLPIRETAIDKQQPLIQKADLMLDLNKKLQETKKEFLDELELQKIPKKLQNFEELEFDEFVKEYKKAKKLKFADKLEERNFKKQWQSLFENDKKEVLKLQNQIDKTDKEIDAMVYELYGLSEDEIKIVEGN
jgi:hypothetical protein